MIWRTGRRNGHTIYEQEGAMPADTDRFVGSAVSDDDAAQLVAAANRSKWCPAQCRCTCHEDTEEADAG